jgi:hypothetical protein
MKKKIVAVLVVLALFTTSVFAAPLSVAAEFGYPVSAQAVVSSEQMRTAPEAFSAIDETGDLFGNALFADVIGTPLTTAESDQVEGGGVIIVIGAILLVVYIANMVMDATKSK